METVVITGASAGVGRALARTYADRGAQVGLIARGQTRLEATAREVAARGGRALPYAADVADASALGAAADRIEAELGPIDIWINAAMVTVFSPIEDLEPAEIRRVTEVTYLGAVHGTTEALKRMRRRNRGKIVQIGSALGYRAIPLQSAYCAAKAAVIAFTDALRTELIHERSSVEVTMMQLPAVNTPQFEWARCKLGYRPQPVPPIYEAMQVARAIVSAIDHGGRETWIGRTTVKAILAQKLAPSVAERFLASSAWNGQMTDELSTGQEEDNLFGPVDSVPYEAEGRFCDRTERYRPLRLGTAERNLAFAGTAAAVATAAVVLISRWSRNRPIRAHA